MTFKNFTVCRQEPVKIANVMKTCYFPYSILPENPASTEGTFSSTAASPLVGLKAILDYLESEAREHNFPEDRFFLLVVDINIYWRMAHWIIRDVNVSPWQRTTLLPTLGSWHPLKV